MVDWRWYCPGGGEMQECVMFRFVICGGEIVDDVVGLG